MVAFQAQPSARACPTTHPATRCVHLPHHTRPIVQSTQSQPSKKGQRGCMQEGLATLLPPSFPTNAAHFSNKRSPTQRPHMHSLQPLKRTPHTCSSSSCGCVGARRLWLGTDAALLTNVELQQVEESESGNLRCWPKSVEKTGGKSWPSNKKRCDVMSSHMP